MAELSQAFRALAHDAEAQYQHTHPDAREALRQEYLSRKGKLATLFARMSEVPENERANVGKIANETKGRIEKLFLHNEERKSLLPEQIKRAHTWTGTQSAGMIGSIHPLVQFLEEVQGIFMSMGFDVVDSPELEDELHNFDLLNIPADNPVRDEWDTFFVKKNGMQDSILRTQTSPMQIRSMKKRKPPVRILVPGRVFRREATDVSHNDVFYQCEGFVVDKGIRFTDLMGTLEAFIKKVFGDKTEIRFRPHHYPFVEPGMDVDMKFIPRKDSSARWMEVLGSGMIHPLVLKNMGVDPKEYSGFAFGLGIDRFAMLRWGIDDIRHLYSGDIKFLEQFR